MTLRQGPLVTSMVAAEFTEPIVIDTYMKGKIVATQGRIESLTIGADPRPNPLGSDHGFIASVQLPDWDPTGEEWPANGDEPEAVIRAATSIGTLAISQMVKGNKNVPPMVETPRIDVLRLGLLHSGVVWSGVRTGCTPGASVRCGADPSDAACYVSLGDAEIVDTWAKAEWAHEYDTAIYVSSFDRLDILKRHRAELWLDDLQTEEHLRIGCAFGREQNFPSGLIAVQAAEGLHGQITIGAHSPNGATGACEPSQGDADLGWWEQATLAANSPAVVLAPDNSWPSAPLPSSAADVAPHYQRLSADLGGGAVGLVPFALHLQDCDPPADAAQASRTFLNSEFCHIPYARNLCEGSDPGEIYSDASIYLQFYGPILAESASERPYEIGIEVNGQPDFSTDYGMWTQYETLPQLAGGAERRLRISGGEFTQLLAGHYYIRPKRTGSARLLCDGLLPGAAATAVAEFTYDFWLVRDCNTNGVDDAEEQTGFCCLNLCDPDYNQDGNADQDDVAYLTNVVAGGYNPTGRDPDFDGDGNVNQDDVQALVNTIGGGGCP